MNLDYEVFIFVIRETTMNDKDEPETSRIDEPPSTLNLVARAK